MGKPTLVYILGTGHCGSTLLDLLLNAHPEIQAMGEVKGLRSRMQGSSPRRRRAPLSEAMIEEPASDPLLQEPFWQRVDRCCLEHGDRGLATLEIRHSSWSELRRWSEDRLTAWAADNALLFDCVHRVSGAPLLTDSSKAAQRLYLLTRAEQFDLRVIHLMRDGRAVISSYLEKNRRFAQTYRIWAGSRLAAAALRRQLREEWIDVSYEALCRNPAGTLSVICEFLGVPYNKRMLAYRAQPYVGIGGNRMRFLGAGEEIVLDETWRHRLRARERVAFDILGGWIERKARRGRAPATKA